MTEDGKPYGPVRYKEIVQEIYFITKNTHISYDDVKDMTPTERKYIVNFIVKDIKKEQEAAQKHLNDIKNRGRN